MNFGEWEEMFVKNDMSRDNDFTGRKIIAFLPPMIEGVFEKHT